MPQSSTALFFTRWLRNPRGVGSVMPSGEKLSAAMAAPAVTCHKRPVLELGGGTGTVTAALLDQGLAPEDLIVLERDSGLHDYLRAKFPKVRVLQADAAYASAALHDEGVPQVGVVVSSLPLLSMPLITRRRIVTDAFRCLARDGFLLQFTYFPASPIPPRMMVAIGIRGRPISRVWRNVPPATVWQYERAPHARVG